MLQFNLVSIISSSGGHLRLYPGFRERDDLLSGEPRLGPRHKFHLGHRAFRSGYASVAALARALAPWRQC